MKEGYEKRIKDLKENHADEIRRIKSEYEKKIQELINTHDNEMADLKMTLEKEKDYAID